MSTGNEEASIMMVDMADPAAPPYPLVERDDYIRLLIQSLCDLGFHQSADMVAKESRLCLQSEAVTKFCEGVLRGDWKAVESFLPELHIDEDDISSVRFLIHEQKFLELLEQKRTIEALECLRKELTPLQHEFWRIHRLSSLMICADVDEMRKRAGWDGAQGTSRTKLLEKLFFFGDVFDQNIVGSARGLVIFCFTLCDYRDCNLRLGEVKHSRLRHLAGLQLHLHHLHGLWILDINRHHHFQRLRGFRHRHTSFFCLVNHLSGVLLVPDTSTAVLPHSDQTSYHFGPFVPSCGHQHLASLRLDHVPWCSSPQHVRFL